MTIRLRRFTSWLCVLITLTATSGLRAERIKDLVSIAGVRSNQLVGYGLVVGLNGTGDQTSQTQFTIQSLKSMLTKLGVAIPDNISPQVKNVAAVMLHAELPAFAKAGQTIDVTVSSIGNASSLRGGALLMTQLKGADGQVYAIAQGNLIVGGFGIQGADGSQITVNIPSSGRIPNGATVEKEVLSAFDSPVPALTLNLHQGDFTTAKRLTDQINTAFGAGTAFALDGTAIRVATPVDNDKKVAFLSLLEDLEVRPGEAPARIIINSRTGTVVIGSHVVVEEAAVAHGNLTVTIAENNSVSQPAPFSQGGQTRDVKKSALKVQEDNNRMFLFKPGVSLDELVRAVNQVGASPSDLVAILEALEQVGALRAELVVI
ncbi:MAG TPA: flagellar basal body P-ring protein FlgI [Candidatus Acidoferrum sp.]|nr:flagellar basal body P-ring protein FlgI [Candidatus Acidoferrum sp.]